MAKGKSHKGRKTRCDVPAREKAVKDRYLARGVENVTTAIPPTYCDHCRPVPFHKSHVEAFDENGYPIPKRSIVAAAPKQPHKAFAYKLIAMGSQEEAQPFRFVDLPPELRNRIYELALSRPEQPVCVPDLLLRPSDDLPDPENILRTCYTDFVYLPCQLHDTLRTMSCGLSRVSKQLHAETMYVPYAINTFSLHNLYYLQTFLQLIGDGGRRHLKSLRFQWKLPEEEAHALEAYTDVRQTYRLLAQCAVEKLDVEIDVVNLLIWRGSGNPRSEALTLLTELPHIEELNFIRGLKNVRISWRATDGLHGMHRWACELIGLWRLPKGVSQSEAEAVTGGEGVNEDTQLRYVEWRA